MRRENWEGHGFTGCRKIRVETGLDPFSDCPIIFVRGGFGKGTSLRGCGKTHLVFGERCVRSRYARKRGSSGRSVQLHPSGEAGRSGTSVAQASGDGRPGVERVGGMVRSAV